MRVFYSLSIILMISLQVKSQSGPVPTTDKAPFSRIVKCYPNPATSIINFDVQKEYDKLYNFQIFSFVGKKVYELNNITAKTVVNLNEFYRGIYIFQLRDRNGKVVDSGKFQVSK
jgi:hypothetical protein